MTNNISIDYDELYIYVYRYFYPYTSIFRCFISIQCLSSAFPAWLWRFRTLLFLWGWSSYPTGSWGHPHRRGLRLLRRFDDFANLAKKLSKRLKETLKHNLLRTVVYTASFFLPVVTCTLPVQKAQVAHGCWSSLANSLRYSHLIWIYCRGNHWKGHETKNPAVSVRLMRHTAHFYGDYDKPL